MAGKIVGRRSPSVLAAIVVVVAVSSASLTAAALTDAAAKAYTVYMERARRSFLDRATQSIGNDTERVALRKEETMVRPGGGDGIQQMPDSLVHHWRATIFIPHTTLNQSLTISRSYSDYPSIFHPVVAAKVLSDDGDTLRVQFRMKQSAGGITSTVDMSSNIRYVRIDATHAYVMSTSDTIREVKDAGRPNERYVEPDKASGYLWRGASFTRWVEADGGVYMEMETIGLSRTFPTFLGWIIEPIARRVGRGSVENSVQEFRRAVLARQSLP